MIRGRMDPVTQALNTKVEQAEFFLSELEKAKERAFERGAYAAAFLSALRSVALYVRTYLEGVGRVRNDRDWVAIISAWESTLAPDVLDRWRAITRLRNEDIHETPIVPEANQAPSMFAGSFFPPAFFPRGYFGSPLKVEFVDPKSGNRFEIRDACSGALVAARKLVSDYKTI
jgi:hypothetical protein